MPRITQEELEALIAAAVTIRVGHHPEFNAGLRHAAVLVRNHEFSDECYDDDVDATLRALAEKLERAAKESER